MFEYLIKLAVVLPLFGGLIFGTLLLVRKFHLHEREGQIENSVKILQTVRLNPIGQLSVVEFGEKRVLLSVSKSGITKIAETAELDG